MHIQTNFNLHVLFLILSLKITLRYTLMDSTYLVIALHVTEKPLASYSQTKNLRSIIA